MPPLLGEDEIGGRLAGLQWQRDGNAIVTTVEASDFRRAVDFVVSLADLAETMDHHPDITIRWNRVELRSSTHSAGGLTHLDFDLAEAVDAMRPPLASEGSRREASPSP
jgi:4a-hydroxytetrahydrobiopterin dehydratase